jgi:two-component system KDP operon response regulator KdpE
LNNLWAAGQWVTSTDDVNHDMPSKRRWGRLWLEDVVDRLGRRGEVGAMAKVLVIDDDPSLLRALRLGLQAGGHDVVVAANGEQGISQTALCSPDVVVLDLGLPDVDGQSVCQSIRQWSEVPIIILSANGAEDRKVATLDSGADDYVTKPFGMAELEARIRTALRHRRSDSEPPLPESITVGPLDIDFIHHETRLHGATVDLTSKEFDVLSFLARHSSKTCTHQMILSAVWGSGYGREAQYLHAYIHRLRQKLDDGSGSLIQTIPGVGYSLTPDPVISSVQP